MVGLFLSERLDRPLAGGRTVRRPALFDLAWRARPGIWDEFAAEEINIGPAYCMAVVNAPEAVLSTLGGLAGVIRLPDDPLVALPADRLANLAGRVGVARSDLLADNVGGMSIAEATNWFARRRGIDKDAKTLAAKIARGVARETRRFRSGPGGTGILETFDGLTENPLSHGGLWAGPIFSGNGALRCNGDNVARPTAADADRYWAAATYSRATGTGCECWVQVPTWPSTSQADVFVCLSGMPGSFGGGDLAGYGTEYDNGTNTTEIYDPETGDTLGTQATVSPASGWYIAITANADGTVKIYHSTDGGSWTLDRSVTDSAHMSGAIGVYVSGTSLRFDNFGGGEFGGGAGAAAGPAARRRSSLICR